jgi:hypothetical protein
MKFEHTGIDNKGSISRGWQPRSFDDFVLARLYSDGGLAAPAMHPPRLAN